MTEALDTRTDTRARLVDVAARLLRDHGPGAVTTRGVAEAAGMQAPTIYRLFGDKDGLLDAVAEHLMATFVADKVGTAATASAFDIDPVEDLRAGWRSYLDFGLAHPTLYALLSDPARALRSPAAQSGLHVLHARVHRIAQSGRLRVSERRAAELIHAAGTGAVLTLLAVPPERRDSALADDLLDAVLARILTDGADAVVEPAPIASAAVALRAVAADLESLTPAEQTLLAEWLDRIIEPGPPDG